MNCLETAHWSHMYFLLSLAGNLIIGKSHIKKTNIEPIVSNIRNLLELDRNENKYDIMTISDDYIHLSQKLKCLSIGNHY